ncbi:MAG: hypothetical protein OXQ92_17790, partial [Boseongicola sp.]|nr:hypothetical protein [Boseongicola sp.]
MKPTWIVGGLIAAVAVIAAIFFGRGAGVVEEAVAPPSSETSVEDSSENDAVAETPTTDSAEPTEEVSEETAGTDQTSDESEAVTDNEVTTDEAAPASDEETAEAEEETAEAEEETAEAEEEAAESEEEAAEAEDETTESEAVVDAAPTLSSAEFDIVRVEPDGSTVIAGRAPAGASIALMMDGEEVERVVADAAGNFVALLSLGSSDTPRVLTMVEMGADGSTLEADQSVILAPSPKVASNEAAEEQTEAATETEVASSETAAEAQSQSEDVVAEVEDSVEGDSPVASDTTTAEAQVPSTESTETELALLDDEAAPNEGTESAETESETQPVEAEESAPDESGADAEVADSTGSDGSTSTSDETTDEVVETEEETQTEEDAAPTVLLADSEGVKVIQQGGDGPQILSNVSIDSISYDQEGDVALAGRSSGQSAVRVYLDNEPIFEADIGDDGQWRANLPEVDTGTYTLRVDELDEEGAVVSRAETPFRREPVEAIQALAVD